MKTCLSLLFLLLSFQMVSAQHDSTRVSQNLPDTTEIRRVYGVSFAVITPGQPTIANGISIGFIESEAGLYKVNGIRVALIGTGILLGFMGKDPFENYDSCACSCDSEGMINGVILSASGMYFPGRINGLGAGGFINMVDCVNGAFIGPFTFVSKLNGLGAGVIVGSNRNRGAQLGIYNNTQENRGLQIGLINVAKKYSSGFQIGLLNIANGKVTPFFSIGSRNIHVAGKRPKGKKKR